MKSLNMISLTFQHTLNFRSRMFVWFLNSLINPLIVLLFWVAVFREKGEILTGWALSEIVSYYLLLMIAGSLLIAHIEEDVAVREIKEGGLVMYLTKPISYYLMKFIDEIPWRLTQGSFGILALAALYVIFPGFITIPNSLYDVLLLIPIVSLAYLISFTFKMIVGLTAFWITDFWGLAQIVEVVILILGGFVMPVDLLPDWLRNIALHSPFPYIVYFPIRAFQSNLGIWDGLSVILTQIIWLGALALIYKVLWNKGLKKFTGVGQ